MTSASAALPKGVERVYARADSGCEAVEAYERRGWQFIISARNTARLVEALKAAEWKPSPFDRVRKQQRVAAGALGTDALAGPGIVPVSSLAAYQWTFSTSMMREICSSSCG